MQIIKTKSFELAVYMQGNVNVKKLALLLPGRLDTKDYPHMRSHVDFLASKDYLSLSFDPPGTWESSGDIKLYTMTNYLKAINELIEYFGNKPTILMGHSRGGSMAMLAGTRNKNVTHIIAAMSHPAPSEMSEKGRQKGFEVSFRDTPLGGKKEFKLPLNYFEDAVQYSNIITEALSKSPKPKLYFLGKKDDNVLPEEVREVYEKSAQPKQLYEVNCEHDYRRHPEIINEINKIVWEFLNKKF
ncbi:MAG: alpha/beta fold hydrolase [archaeon]|nr:alpha/beta fold hydrolase [archaeon]